MAVSPRVRTSRAGINRAMPIGFRRSGFRDRFHVLQNPSYVNFPPVWYSQTLGARDIQVAAGALVVVDLGIVAGSCAEGRIELFGAQYWDAGIPGFTDVTNELGTQFYNVDFKLLTDNGTLFNTRHVIGIKPKKFKTYLVGGERLYLYVQNNQAVAVNFSIEILLEIESMRGVQKRIAIDATSN